jgi:hypothetical protein
MRDKEIRIALTTSISYLVSFISYCTVCCPPPVCTQWLDVHYKDMKNHFATFFIIKPTRCTNFPNLLRHEILHVSGSSSARHQEFIHCILGTGKWHTGLKTAVEQDQDGTSWSCYDVLFVTMHGHMNVKFISLRFACWWLCGTLSKILQLSTFSNQVSPWTPIFPHLVLTLS